MLIFIFNFNFIFIYNFNFIEKSSKGSAVNQQQQQQQQQSKHKSQHQSGNEYPNRVVIAESAKEIYLTGYKAATDNILKKLSNVYNISGAELQNLTGVIGVPKDVSIPNMMLVHPSSNIQTPQSKEDTNQTDTQHQQEEFDNDDFIEVDDNNNNNSNTDPPSPTFSNKNLKHDTDWEQNTDQLGPILLSCMMQNPVTSQYHSTLLPLNSLLSPTKEVPISMPRLYRQSKLAMEMVISQKKESTNHKYMKRSESPKLKPHFLVNNSSKEQFAQGMTLKRKYSDDRQVPVITGSRKRPPKLLHEQFIANPVPLTSHFSVRNGGISVQQKEIFSEINTRCDITTEMASKEFQNIYSPSFNHQSTRNHLKNDWMTDVERESLREKFW